MRLLLLSNGGKPDFLAYAKDEIKNFLGDVKDILVIPYAKSDTQKVMEKLKGALETIGLEIISIEDFPDKADAIKGARSIFVPGGNTFLLLKNLYDLDLLDVLEETIRKGTPYIGYSAGVNIVAPNIMTSNDMAIVEPPSFNSLSLVPFNVNVHYFDPIPGVPAETKVERIKEFLEVNPDALVLGLKEYTMLKVEGERMRLIGEENLKVFEYEKEPKEYSSSDDLDFFLNKFIKS